MKSKPEKYLYRINPLTGSVIIATEQRARFVGQIQHALQNSRTWNEFKLAIPKDEYARIMGILAEDEIQPLEPTELFKPADIPGFSDGDYPPWLEAEVARVVPLEILKKFATYEQSVLNGPFWTIPAANCDAILEALTATGFILERAQDVPFA